jgi:hypothetical protein
MLQDLTPASFEAHQGTTFRIDYGSGAPLEVVLHQVRRHEPHPGARAEPFSAYFLGPRAPVLPQKIYKVEHGPMGTLELFLVPIGPDPKAGGMLYEAVFN